MIHRNYVFQLINAAIVEMNKRLPPAYATQTALSVGNFKMHQNKLALNPMLVLSGQEIERVNKQMHFAIRSIRTL